MDRDLPPDARIAHRLTIIISITITIVVVTVTVIVTVIDDSGGASLLVGLRPAHARWLGQSHGSRLWHIPRPAAPLRRPGQERLDPTRPAASRLAGCGNAGVCERALEPVPNAVPAALNYRGHDAGT